MACHRFLRRFWRAKEGSSAIEFALAAPIVILTMAAIIDFMMVLFVSSLMEGGLQNASRLGRTGFQTVAVTVPRIDAIRQEIADATIGMVNMDDLTVATRVYPCFDSIGEPEPYIDADASGSYDIGEVFTDVNGNGTRDLDMAATGFGGPGSVVLYTVAYDWAALTPLIGNFFGPDGKMPIGVSVAVRNEPFDFTAPLVTGPAGTGTTGC